MAATLSILVISYNRPEDSLALLENIKMQREWKENVGEIYLLNNASTISYAPVENFIEEHPEMPVHYIPHHKNLGVAGGRSFLIKKARYPLLLFLDDDVVFKGKDAIQKMAQLFNKDQYVSNNTSVITPQILYFQNGQQQKSAFPHKNYDQYKNKEWFLTYYFTGAAHLMKKELFEKTGFYPKDFFYGMEEYDLSYRIIQSGYSLAYDNSVQILHKESPLGRVSDKEKLAMMWYNKCVVAWRYLPKKYFYSTAFLWAGEYLRKTKWHLPGIFKNSRKIRQIPKKIARQKIGTQAFRYLRQVKARLWY